MAQIPEADMPIIIFNETQKRSNERNEKAQRRFGGEMAH